MRNLGRVVWLAVICGLVVACPVEEEPDVQCTPAYSIVDLGTLGGDLSVANAINNRGEVVGAAELATGGTSAFLWRDGEMTALESAPTTSGFIWATNAHDINDHGEIVGSGMYSDNDVSWGGGSAFYWSQDAGTVGIVDYVEGSPYALARGINASGTSVGDMGVAGAFVWPRPPSGEAVTVTLPGGPERSHCELEKINDEGTAVGGCTEADSRYRPVRWTEAAGATIIEAFADFRYGVARDINNLGQIVVYAQAPEWPSATGYIVDADGGRTELPTLGNPVELNSVHPEAINNLGEVVGADHAYLSGVRPRAWLWRDGEKHALEDLVPPLELGDWQLWYANDVNDHGQIVGQGTFNGIPGRAFLMTPTGECMGRPVVCGDGIVGAPDEACDDGPRNSDEWRMERHCDASCRSWAPYCGDGELNGTEACDDGEHNGEEGRCRSDCSGRVSACHAASYVISELPVMGVWGDRAQAISDRGDVAWTAVQSSGTFKAFVWENGVTMDLETDRTVDIGRTRAVAANSRGEVVGSGMMETADGGLWGQGFYWHPDLGLVPLFPDAETYSEVGDINNHGTIVGDIGNIAFVLEVGEQPFEPGSSAPTMLGVPSEDYHATEAWGVNELGTVVGSAWQPPPTNYPQAFRWTQDTGFDLLERAPGSASCEAYDINDANLVVGYCGQSWQYGHAVVWQAGAVQELAPLANHTQGRALAVNDRGEVVGWDGSPTPSAPNDDDQAWIWRDGVKTDLESITANLGDWDLQQATDINNGGQIVGWGAQGGASRAFVLSPMCPQ